MTRTSLENLTRRTSSNWHHGTDSNAVEMQPAPRLSVNEWRTSTDVNHNPFSDPAHHADSDSVNQPSAAHTHQDHIDTHPTFASDVEAQNRVPKAATASINALNLNLPYGTPRMEHPQKTHRIFLTCRGLLQVLLFVLALIGFLLRYPKRITYVGMLTGNCLAFVCIWGVLLIFVYFLDDKLGNGGKGMRMSRYATKSEQLAKCLRMLVFDAMIVWVWFLVCWGNTAFARGVMAEANKPVPGPGKNGGHGAPQFTNAPAVPKPTGH